jgi:hypothetical protein
MDFTAVDLTLAASTAMMVAGSTAMTIAGSTAIASAGTDFSVDFTEIRDGLITAPIRLATTPP